MEWVNSTVLNSVELYLTTFMKIINKQHDLLLTCYHVIYLPLMGSPWSHKDHVNFQSQLEWVFLMRFLLSKNNISLIQLFWKLHFRANLTLNLKLRSKPKRLLWSCHKMIWICSFLKTMFSEWVFTPREKYELTENS